MASDLSRYVLWLNDRAERNGLLHTEDDEATEILAALAHGYGNPVGAEMYAGTVKNPKAKVILRHALIELKRLPVALEYLDSFGYTPMVVRALLMNHIKELMNARVGSEEHLTYVDLQSAVKDCSPKTKQVAAMLVVGIWPQEIEARLKTNAGRLIKEAMREIAGKLGGLE